MNEADWHEVERVMAAALDLPDDQRASYLARCCADQPAVRVEVESLLAADRRAGPFLQAKTGFEGPASGRPASLAGRSLGPYKLLDEIGRGGMGAVYRAQRDDGRFQKQVAVKVTAAPLLSAELLRRFQSEQQILATLEHPNIARLLDAGVWEECLPYIVMEYVEGVPIDRYVREQRPPVAECLRLFRVICSAVHHAHQRLVVHRDLKPANILVTAEGVPKLLDFGIAKILGAWPEEPHACAPSLLNPLTPDYASPEQLRGAALTTASDLYSLGVLLYELLAGERPYDLAGKPLEEAIRLVCETEPIKPNAASPLSGDLDAIVDKAMRKEPHGRYASAEELSTDIGRYLAGLPVLARRGSFRYVARKFVGRHRFGAVTGLLVALLIVAGGAAIVRQAHIADLQRGRAERRFQDVRQLANALIFEVHDSIKDLPGATQARKLLVSRALAYLDSLSSEAGGDVALQRELATAYERVADVQGNPRFANLGDTPSALVSYRKALTIRETLARDDPGNRNLMLGLAGTYDNIGWCLDAVSDLAGALEHLRKALTIKETLAPHTNDPKEADQLAGAYYGVATVQSEIGDLQDALGNYRKAASIRNAAGAATPSQSVPLRTHLAGDYAGMARVLDSQGNTAAAIEAQAQATALLKDVSSADPTNATVQRFLAWSEEYQGIYQEKSGLFDDAFQSFQQARRIFEVLSRTDPSDALTERRLAFTAVHIGTVLAKKGAPSQGLKQLEAALASFQALAARVPANDYILAGFADCYSSMGLANVKLAEGTKEASRMEQHLRLARSYFQKSLQLWLDLQRRGALVTEDARKVQEIEKEIARCDTALGRAQQAGRISSR